MRADPWQPCKQPTPSVFWPALPAATRSNRPGQRVERALGMLMLGTWVRPPWRERDWPLAAWGFGAVHSAAVDAVLGLLMPIAGLR